MKTKASRQENKEKNRCQGPTKPLPAQLALVGMGTLAGVATSEVADTPGLAQGDKTPEETSTRPLKSLAERGWR